MLIGHSQVGEDMKLFRSVFCDIKCETQQSYVEIGALDGVKYSNTLMYERSFGWGGLLIEGNPASARGLVQNRGKSGRNLIINEAVCDKAGSVTFYGTPGSAVGGVRETMSDKYYHDWSRMQRLAVHYSVPCRPIGEMIRLAGIREVSLFSLDVEGAELQVLQTMDWTIPVKLWMIEEPNDQSMQDGKMNYTRAKQIQAILEQNGYVKAPEVDTSNNAAYVHRDLAGDVLKRRLRECASRVGGPHGSKVPVCSSGASSASTAPGR